MKNIHRGKLTVFVYCAFLLNICFIPGRALAVETTDLTLGTATKGGGFELFGNTLVSELNKQSLPFKLTTRATRGSKQNLKLLASGSIAMGLVEGNAARQALEGIGAEKLDLKVISVMYPNPGMFAVRANSPYNSINDLKNKPIAFGTQASGLRILVNDVLTGMGLDPEKDFQPVILKKAADGPELVLNNQVEALWGAGIGWPGFVKLANSSTGVRFIPPSGEEIQRILKRHPHLRKMQVPAATYKGQNKAIDSIGLWSLILVRPDVPIDTVYALTKALHRSEAGMKQAFKQGAFTTVKNTATNVEHQLLHPGVIKYYREIGLL